MFEVKRFGLLVAEHRPRRPLSATDQEDNPILGGLFSTHDYPHGKNGWIDCFFLGNKPPAFYNCVIDTTRNAYKDQVRELAYEQSYPTVPSRRGEAGLMEAFQSGDQ